MNKTCRKVDPPKYCSTLGYPNDHPLVIIFPHFHILKVTTTGGVYITLWMENYHFQWLIPLFLWPCSRAKCSFRCDPKSPGRWTSRVTAPAGLVFRSRLSGKRGSIFWRTMEAVFHRFSMPMRSEKG